MHSRTPESDWKLLGCKSISEMSPEERIELAAKIKESIERDTIHGDNAVKETADQTKDL